MSVADHSQGASRVMRLSPKMKKRAEKLAKKGKLKIKFNLNKKVASSTSACMLVKPNNLKRFKM